MEDIIKFLSELSQHNDREWFNAHKADYLNAKQQFDVLVESLIAGVNEFDPEIGALTVSDCTWRIYRDTRFSYDKRPYKTQMGGYFAPRGKRGPFSGYYFQIGIDEESGLPVGMIATGNYYTEPAVLRILREDIDLDEAKSIKSALTKAKGFHLDSEQMLKRVPRGFDAEKPWSDLFRYKNFCLVKNVDAAYLRAADFRERLLADFKTTKPFLRLLNRAIAFNIESSQQ